jgi:hypothetical protein
MKRTLITKESLLKYGMQEVTDESKMIIPMKKVLTSSSEDGTEMAICVTNLRNKSELCLMLPDGSCLYLWVKTIEELQIFEHCILLYESNY